MEIDRVENITVVEWDMMNKTKYFQLALVNGFAIRTVLYPFTLIKTRIQVQKHKSVYNGTFDAFYKITKMEGLRGLYRGFWVSNGLVLPQMAYIYTYEGVRHLLSLESTKLKSLIAGACASLVGQTFIVPIDVVSQHLMMLGKSVDKTKQSTQSSQLNPLSISDQALKSRFGATAAVCSAVYRQSGILGFYKGYLPSILVYAPNSALWWFFYDLYCGIVSNLAPVWVPRLLLQCIAAPLGGVSAALFTNPFDIVRARIQVERSQFVPTVEQLWREERFGIFIKGLSARLIQSTVFSTFIILGYESVKRASLLDEYKEKVRW